METYDHVLVVFVFFIVVVVVIIIDIYASAFFVLVVVACHGRRIDLVLVILGGGPARGIVARSDVILVNFRRGVEIFLILLDVAAIGCHGCEKDVD